MNQSSILSYTLESLQNSLLEQGFESFRAKQIFHFLYQKNVKSFSEMNNLPKKLIEYLVSQFHILGVQEENHIISERKDTHKYLFTLMDNMKVESVIINEGSRNTLCLSSQVGCSLNCVFCATGQMGMKRNLSSGEMISQFLFLKGKHGQIDNIVFMGMGEPLLNYNNLINTIKILNSKEGLNFGIRRITISTAGVAKNIRRLADENLHIHLAVSLNSPDPMTRINLMPFSKRIPLKEVLDACKFYQEKTKRRITFEYVLFKGINSSKKDAKSIIKLFDDLQFNLNIIPYNPIDGCKYETPSHDEVEEFTRYFQYSKIEVVQRKRKGRDISAACGQLATHIEDKHTMRH